MFANFRRPRLLGLAGASLLVLALAGCADDDTAATTGSAYSQALYKDYTELATQTAAAPAPPSDDSFFDNPFGLFGSASNPNDMLVTAFTDKANLAQPGQDPAPEAPPADPVAQTIRGRLVRA